MADPDADRRAALLQARAAVSGGAAVSDAEIESAADGIRALRQVLEAASFPSVVGGLRSILAEAPLSELDKAPLSRQIDSIVCPLGCLRFDIPGGTSLHVFLAGCPSGHDTSAQLGRLRCRLDDSAWDSARKQISNLLLFARQMYAGYCQANAAFVASLSGRPPGADCTDLFAFSVDAETTTLFLKKEWSRRVGFYVLDGVEAPPPI